MKKIKVRASEIKDLPKWPVSYGKKLRVMVPYPENPREGKCDACNRKVGEGITTTHLHHHIYAYKHPTIRKNPLKALENNSELCYMDHRIGDAFRELLRWKKNMLWHVIVTADLMPEEVKEKLDWICRAWLEKRKDEKTKLNHFFRNS